jgi:hypothetical protein
MGTTMVQPGLKGMLACALRRSGRAIPLAFAPFSSMNKGLLEMRSFHYKELLCAFTGAEHLLDVKDHISRNPIHEDTTFLCQSNGKCSEAVKKCGADVPSAGHICLRPRLAGGTPAPQKFKIRFFHSFSATKVEDV